MLVLAHKEGIIMHISRVSSTQYNQNFGGVFKSVPQKGLINFFSENGKHLGYHLQKANGDVRGNRRFAKGYEISYDSSHGTLFEKPYVILQYRYPVSRKERGRKLLVFDLEKFKENLRELTTLKGIKGYFAKIETAPKTTKFEPCC